MAVTTKDLKAVEGIAEVKAIRTSSPTNYAVFFVKKGRKKSFLKFQEAGPGGLAEVRAALDKSKVQFFLFRVTGIDERAGAKSIRSKFVRGCYTGSDVPAMAVARAGVIQSDVFQFLQDAQKSYQISSIEALTEEIVEADLRAAAGAHQVQRFDFANAEARISSKKPSSAPKKAAPSAAPAAAAPVCDDDGGDDDDDDDTAEPPKPASSASSDPIKFTYFGAHGRGEAIRLILKAGGVEFEDERLDFPTWGKIKADPDSVPSQLFGTLPVLTHGDFKIGQSRAVQTYAAHIALASTCATPKAAAIDAMFQNAHADVQSELYKCVFGSDEGKAEATAKIDESVKPHLEAIERNLPDSGFIKGGDKPSAADIVVFDLGSSSLPDIKGLGVDVSKYPKFNKLVATVGEYPPIAAYVAERS